MALIAVTAWRMVRGRFRLQPDRETETIHQVNHRQMEGLRQVDEAGDLAGCRGTPGAAAEQRIAGQDGDRPAVQSRETGDDGRPKCLPISKKLSVSTTDSMILRML